MQVRGDRAQREAVACGAEPDDRAERDIAEVTVPAKRFAGVNVRQVNLDERQPDAGQRVAQRNARVREGAGVDQDRRRAVAARGVHALDQRVLRVALVRRQPDAERSRLLAQPGDDVVERARAVMARLPTAQQVQVRPVDQQDVMRVPGHAFSARFDEIGGNTNQVRECLTVI